MIEEQNPMNQNLDESTVEGVQATLEGMASRLNDDPVSVLYELVKITGALVVNQNQLSNAFGELADGMDELADVMENSILGPFAKEGHRRSIDALKEKLIGDEHNFGEFADTYKRLYNKDLLNETAERLLEVKSKLEEGQEFDEGKWISDEYDALKEKLFGVAPTVKTVEVSTTEKPEESEVDEEVKDESLLKPEEIKKILKSFN